MPGTVFQRIIPCRFENSPEGSEEAKQRIKIYIPQETETFQVGITKGEFYIMDREKKEQLMFGSLEASRNQLWESLPLEMSEHQKWAYWMVKFFKSISTETERKDDIDAKEICAKVLAVIRDDVETETPDTFSDIIDILPE
jgi:hypothetical protein